MTAVTVNRAAAAMRAAGLDVVIAAGAMSAKRPGLFDPVGVMVHHTGSKGACLALLRDGRKASKGVSALPPPVVQLNIERSGRVHLISTGRSNHAGRGSSSALDRVRAGLPPAVKPGADGADGNAWFVGIEVDNDGVGEPWTDAQYRAAVIVAAVWLRLLGRPDPDRAIAHREWTRRKPDPHGIDMNALRADVGDVLRQLGTAPPGEKPAAPAPAKAPVKKAYVRPWPGYPASRTKANTRVLQERLNRGGHGRDTRGRLKPLVVDGLLGPATTRALRRFQQHAGLKVDGLLGPVTWLRMFPETKG